MAKKKKKILKNSKKISKKNKTQLTSKSKSTTEPPKAGRPSVFTESLQEKMIALYEKGKTDVQVAEIVGVSEKTINNWKGKHPTFLQSLKEAKQIADDLVEASLFSRAVGYSHQEEKTFQHDGEIISHTVTKHYAPDPVSMIFWLKNRQPGRWRDDKRIVVEGEVEHNVKVSKVDLDTRIKQLKKKAV